MLQGEGFFITEHYGEVGKALVNEGELFLFFVFDDSKGIRFRVIGKCIKAKVLNTEFGSD